MLNMQLVVQDRIAGQFLLSQGFVAVQQGTV